MQESGPNFVIIDGCLKSAVKGLRLSIGELWRRRIGHRGVTFECVHVAVPSSVAGELPEGMLVTDKDHAKHPMSAQLCKRAMVDKVPLWYTTANEGTVLHPTGGFKTAITIPIYSYQIQQEFYTLFFALESVPSSMTSISLLREISKAVVMACGVCLEEQGSVVDELDAPPVTRLKLNDISVFFTKPDLMNTFFQFTDLHEVKHVADGGSSAIYTAQYNGTSCCVKMLTPECDKNPTRAREMRNEIEIMLSLNHPNIVQVIGSGQEPRMFVVMEYLTGGSLNEELGFGGINSHHKNGQSLLFRKSPPKSLRKVYQWAHQLADALRFMHDDASPGHAIMHRDIKPDNVCLTQEGLIKLIDFGLAKSIPKDLNRQAPYNMTGETGSTRYMAPEVALNKHYNEKADVYSYSLIVWQMATLAKPYETYDRQAFIQKVARGGERPALDKRWPPEFSQLLESCWHVDPAQRPSMAEVCQTLKELIEKQAQLDEKDKYQHQHHLLGGIEWPFTIKQHGSDEGGGVFMRKQKSDGAATTSTTAAAKEKDRVLHHARTNPSSSHSNGEQMKASTAAKGADNGVHASTSSSNGQQMKSASDEKEEGGPIRPTLST